MTPADSGATLGLLPVVEARAVLGERRTSLAILRPAYPVIGLGTLRVLRIRERGETTEIVAGYDGYERLPLEAGKR